MSGTGTASGADDGWLAKVLAGDPLMCRLLDLARTQGQSSSTQSGGVAGSRNRGVNVGLSEQARELIKPDEVRTRMRADEAIIFRRGAAPLRCGRPIFFRRPEMKARVEADRYRTAAE